MTSLKRRDPMQPWLAQKMTLTAADVIGRPAQRLQESPVKAASNSPKTAFEGLPGRFAGTFTLSAAVATTIAGAVPTAVGFVREH